MILTILGVLLLLQTPASPARQPQSVRRASASIEGFVVRVGSGEPLARARITLVSAGGSGTNRASPSPASPTATTGADGRFVLQNVTPGSYRIAAARNGYARQEYGQRVFGGQGTVVTIVAGQRLRGIGFHLTPTGAVAGIVQDSSGEPLAGAHVQVFRSSYNASGQRTLQAVGGDRTNDRGEYRVYWITPGRYYVAVSGAAPDRSAPTPGGVGSVNAIVDRRFPTAYYPGTSDAAQASMIEVAPGAELTTVDIVVPEQDLFHVSGRIVDPFTGRHPPTASVSVIPRGLSAALGGVTSTTQSYRPVDGTFELRDVAPGSYWIRAIVAARSADSILTADAAGRSLADVFVDGLFSERQVAQAPLDLFGDADGLVLTLGSGVPIRGVVSADDQPWSAVAGLERVEVTLVPAVGGMLSNPSRQPVGSDGTFVLPDVLPGEYSVTVQGLPPDYYLKGARVGQADALDRPLLVSAPAVGLLTVLVSARGGQIEGVVVDERRQPVSGIEAVLVPARRPARRDRYKTAITGKAGDFTIRGIPPGDYVVWAWEAIESFGYFDDQLLKQSDPLGLAVRIDESSRERLEVTMIPGR